MVIEEKIETYITIILYFLLSVKGFACVFYSILTFSYLFSEKIAC